MEQAIDTHCKMNQQKEERRKQPIRYRTRWQTEEEKEELAIAEEFDDIRNIKELTTLLREGKMKEFYQ